MFGWGAKKVAAEQAAIPAEVLAIIEGASLYTRPGTDNQARVIVQAEGWSGFMFSEESAERWLAKAFPELTEEQKTRAVNYLAALVRSHHRESQPERKRTNWVNRWRYQDEIE
ncbi:hypothetical protein OP658_002902 [Cronobacter sakazakii]|uniref:hypothetical protein n=1 Tax=Cronobacter sakazakii TaxID=28141 RepID=UPI000CF0D206|nr:hypothetical protein [Cronobacter sakazakii]EIX1654476.1 hypothetical protein [Cronobacter sakazakii]EIX1762579.1 hypothetical protein [Cronobacter sakazakii]EIX6120014.1 hypothetical protein [Cronobacter sakazakii]EIX6208628.1 hypothetical protein [Cronobacter sakazakii]EJQ0793805.1 hypothetical protein [Cronobacter sakazakii]